MHDATSMLQSPVIQLTKDGRMFHSFSHYEVVIVPRENGVPGPAVALEGPGCIIQSNRQSFRRPLTM